MASVPSVSRLGDIPSGAATSHSSIPDDPCFHLAPFHSFQRVFTSSRSLVYRALRSPPSPPTSAASATTLPSSPSSSLPASSSVSSSALYASCSPESAFALKFLINCREGAFRPVNRAQLSLFSQQYELLCQMRDKGVHGVIRPFELIGVQLPLQLPSATSSSSSSVSSPSPSSATSATSSSSASFSILAASNSASNSHLPSTSATSAMYSTLCLVTEFFPGSAMSTLYSQPRYSSGFPLLEFLPVALSILSSVASIHSAHILHKDLTHNNVLYDPATRATRIIDFGLSEIQLVDSAKGGKSTGASDGFQGTLAFVSPEQTGRVNRGVDARSDLYSVGVMLYQMATGQLPFVAQERDELELVHAIITRLPAAPITVRPSLPSMVSAIIMKLLNKNADERYQSARGVEQDVQKVYSQLLTQTEGITRSPRLAPTSLHGTTISPLRSPSPGGFRSRTPSPPASPSLPPLHPATATASSHPDLSIDVSASPMHSSPGEHKDDSGPASGNKARTLSLPGAGDTPVVRPTTPPAASPPAVLSPSDSLLSSQSSSASEPIPVITSTAPRPLPPTDDQLNLAAMHFPSFLLGRGDVPSRLQIPSKLYGREKEISAIRQSFEAVLKSGQSLILCVDGVAGAGKSSTIRQSCSGISASSPNCLVASSKLDQYNRQPFGMFKQLVSEIVLDILTQPTRVLAKWRASVMRAVGSSGALMIDMFPSLQQLIGEQPPVPVLPPAEAQQRLQLVFTGFLCCFCPPHRPLVMLFDDVQWADDNSLQGLEHFTANPDCKHVLIMLAYRKEEMHPRHSLMLTLDHMRQAGKNVQSITCNPLTPADLQQMVADTLHCSLSHAQTVASLLSQRCDGNPFFARQLLLQLHRDRLITYHAAVSPKSAVRSNTLRPVEGAADAQQIKGEWRFNSQLYLSLSAGQQLTSNVLDLVNQLIRRLSSTAQRLLSLAACIGTQFDADTLAVVSELTRGEVTAALREAMTEELITLEDNSARAAPPSPSANASASASGELSSGTSISSDGSDGYSIAITSPRSTHSSPPHLFFTHIVYSFVHDRIQQGAYLAIPEAVRAATHLQIARLLRAAEEKKERDELSEQEEKGGSQQAKSTAAVGRSFEIANHFLKGAEVLCDAQSKAEADILSVSAFLADVAAAAKQAGSYQSGLAYAQCAQWLLGLERVRPMAETHVADDSSEEAKLDDESVRERWSGSSYALCLQLASERGELEYLCGRLPTAEHELHFALNKVSKQLDRVKLYQQLLSIYMAASRFPDAISISRKALAELGQYLPLREADMTDEQKAQAATLPITFDNMRYLPCSPALDDVIFAELQQAIADRPIPALIDLPTQTDKQQRAIIAIMSGVLAATYINEQPLYPSLNYLAVLRSVRSGLTGFEPYILTSVGALRQATRADLLARNPQAWGALAIAVLDKFDVHGSLRARAVISNAVWLQHWTTDARTVVQWLASEGLQEALAGGDMLFALYFHIANLSVGMDFRTLHEQEMEVERARESNSRMGNDRVLTSVYTGHQFAINVLTAQTVVSAAMTPEEESFVSRTELEFPLASSTYLIARARAQLILCEPQMALHLLARAHDKFSYIAGQLTHSLTQHSPHYQNNYLEHPTAELLIERLVCCAHV